MKTYEHAYEEPATDVLGSEGPALAAYRFCRDLAYFSTGVRAPYTVRAGVHRLALRRAAGGPA